MLSRISFVDPNSVECRQISVSKFTLPGLTGCMYRRIVVPTFNLVLNRVLSLLLFYVHLLTESIVRQRPSVFLTFNLIHLISFCPFLSVLGVGVWDTYKSKSKRDTTDTRQPQT